MPDHVTATEKECAGKRRTLGRYVDDGEAKHVFGEWKKARYPHMSRRWRGVVVLEKKFKAKHPEPPQMRDVGTAVAKGGHGWYEADDGVIMCVGDGGRAKMCPPDSKVVSVHPCRTTWARSKEALQSDSEQEAPARERRGHFDDLRDQPLSVV